MLAINDSTRCFIKMNALYSSPNPISQHLDDSANMLGKCNVRSTKTRMQWIPVPNLPILDEITWLRKSDGKFQQTQSRQLGFGLKDA